MGRSSREERPHLSANDEVSMENSPDHAVNADYSHAEQRERQKIEYAGHQHICAIARTEAGDMFEWPAAPDAVVCIARIEPEEEQEKD
jgi:hypothetical protein